MNPTPDALPTSVKLAAAFFVMYGAAVLSNAVAMQSVAGWVAAVDVPRTLVRLFGSLIIAWGLMRRARWAWWLGLGFAVLWLAAGGLSVLVLERGDVYWLPPSRWQIFLVVSLLSLGFAVALLLSPSARAVFRRPAGSSPIQSRDQ